MKFKIGTLIIIVVSLINLNWKIDKKEGFKPQEIYKSKDLVITQISPNSFKHTSYLQTDEFGNVPCNGLIVRNKTETIIFDTPTKNETSVELIKWIKDSLQCKINAIIPTHFHNDCLGGLKAFHENNIPSFANYKTIELAKENEFEVPQNGFEDSLVLKVGSENIIAKYFGEGHTKDNVIGYFKSEEVMFGGCLIKELKASKGYLGDANVNEWSNTVEKIKKKYPNVKIVVPGHGAHGNKKLLDYTINLFSISPK